jgi:hypothetical protein
VNRVARWCLVVYGVGWLVVPGFFAVVIRLQVPNPGELLRDVADHRAMWIGANVLLIVLQVPLIVAGPSLARSVEHAGAAVADAVRGLVAVAAGSLIASGVFHGVLGAHLADEVTTGPLDPDLVRVASVVHALGDTAWFVGLGAVAVTTALCSIAWWRSPVRATRLVAWLGAVAVAVGLLQFGWFVDRVFGLFAAPGTLLQAAWFVAVGATTTGRPPVAVAVAPTTRSPTRGAEPASVPR